MLGPMPCNTTVESVVKNDLCIGCGACVALCARHHLAIDMEQGGLYKVKRQHGNCPDKCGLCIQVCPFGEGNPNEDDLATSLFSCETAPDYIPVMGYVLSTWVGYSKRIDQRLSGASGGLTTWFLSELLRQGIVDRVACVEPQHGSNPLFRYKLCNSVDEVQRASGSAYYPVEMSEVLAEIIHTEARYALVCLPCFAKAVRLAAAILPKVKQRIVCIAGLVCGHTVSTYFADYVGRLAGSKQKALRGITFRTKSPDRPAKEIGIKCEWGQASDTSAATVLWSQGPGEAWSEHWFTPNPCMYCDDVFAETADVVFMDAWLPEYEMDYRGTNLVLIRSELPYKVLLSGVESDAVSLEPCSPEKVILSQLGAVEWKRDALSHRLWRANQEGRLVPAKRIQSKLEADPGKRKLVEGREKAARIGCKEWTTATDVETFRTRMRRYSGWNATNFKLTDKSIINRALVKLRRLIS